jgi:hypothetical protein
MSASESRWIEVNTGMYGSGGSHSRHTDYRVQIVPEDGQPRFESTMSSWGKFADWGNMIAGYSIYVFYDPHERERCELDREWFCEVQANWPEDATRDPEWLRQRREQKLERLHQRVDAAGGHPDPDSDPAAYWFQRSQQALAASHATRAESGVASGAALPGTAPPIGPAAGIAGPAASAATAEDRLEMIEKLHESGALGDDEYDARRQQIIDSI